MRRRNFISLSLVLVCMVSLCQAADSADPTGTWKWKVSINNQDREMSAKLKLDGDKLTGTVPGPDNTEIKITDATFKDGEVAFTVSRERDGQKFVVKYKGKLDGDTIKGKADVERNGTTMTRDWEPKREKK
ncbi:hypothetical protein [Schlesneria paludicola]|uniref:hypothetical protein n=1 Tax=Schlesneria paludicola TaxID=360056 RepID=UPI00030B6848|nr:hypothetical protein [Schlesneria paludicola]